MTIIFLKEKKEMTYFHKFCCDIYCKQYHNNIVNCKVNFQSELVIEDQMVSTTPAGVVYSFARNSARDSAKNINEIRFLMDERNRLDRKSNSGPPLVDSPRIRLSVMRLGSRYSQI